MWKAASEHSTYIERTMRMQRIAFNYAFPILFFRQVYLCFLSIAFVKSRGKGHGQVCPGKDGPCSPALSWSCEGYTHCAREQYSAVTAAKPPPREENRESPAFFPQLKTLLQSRKPLCSGALRQDGPLTAAFSMFGGWSLLFVCLFSCSNYYFGGGFLCLKFLK